VAREDAVSERPPHHIERLGILDSQFMQWRDFRHWGRYGLSLSDITEQRRQSFANPLVVLPTVSLTDHAGRIFIT
jgi:hypothetical protein